MAERILQRLLQVFPHQLCRLFIPPRTVALIDRLEGTAVIGVSLGILSAVRQYSVLDHVCVITALVFASVPGFWLGLMLMLVFALHLGLLSSYGAASLMALAAGATLGATAGYFGGVADNVICRIVDVFMCVPPILLSLAVVAALGTNLRNLIIAITVSCIPGNVRLIRSVVLTVSEQDYIRAAKSYGTSNFRIIFRYVLPNAIGPIIVNTTVGISGMILSAAGLSFIGMGIQPPSPE